MHFLKSVIKIKQKKSDKSLLYDPLKGPCILDCYWHEKVISPIWFGQLHCAGVPKVTARIPWVCFLVGRQIAQFLKAAHHSTATWGLERVAVAGSCPVAT